MKTIKIRYHNCEEQGSVELLVDCKPSQFNMVQGLLRDFGSKHQFHTSAHNFVDELKKYGFKAKELKYDIEV